MNRNRDAIIRSYDIDEEIGIISDKEFFRFNFKYPFSPLLSIFKRPQRIVSYLSMIVINHMKRKLSNKVISEND